MFLIGPIVALLLLGIYHLVVFNEIVTTSYKFQNEIFRDQQLFLGVFDGPKLARLFWLSLHPYRGLFYCCPLFLLSIFAIGRLQWRKPVNLDVMLALAIMLNFVMFNISFAAWSGGWGIGPRYIIPAIPFLYIFAPDGFSQQKLLATLVILVSSVNMLIVSAVSSMLPASDFGPPQDFNPVRFAILTFLRGEVSVSQHSILEFGPGVPVIHGASDFWDSYNLGEVMGLRGIESVLPVLIVLCIFLVIVTSIIDADSTTVNASS